METRTEKSGTCNGERRDKKKVKNRTEQDTSIYPPNTFASIQPTTKTRTRVKTV